MASHLIALCRTPHTYIYICPGYKFVGQSEIGFELGRQRHCTPRRHILHRARVTSSATGMCYIYRLSLYCVSCRVHTDYFQAQAPSANVGRSAAAGQEMRTSIFRLQQEPYEFSSGRVVKSYYTTVGYKTKVSLSLSLNKVRV